MTRPDRILRALSAATLSLALALAASPVRAAEPVTPTTTAEQLAEQAYQEHAAGKDAEAIATYLRAYELSKAGAILFNVAVIYDRKLHERGLAEDYYRRYLVAPDAEPDLVRKATERLTALKKEDDAEASAKSGSIAVAPISSTPSAAVPAPVEPIAPSVAKPAANDATASAPSTGRPLRTAGIVVGAVGIAGLGTSLVLGALAKGKNDDANAMCNGSACSSDRGVTLAHDAGTFASASTVAFVAGLALVGGSVTMILLAPKSTTSPAARVTLAPRVGLGHVGLSLGGSF